MKFLKPSNSGINIVVHELLMQLGTVFANLIRNMTCKDPCSNTHKLWCHVTKDDDDDDDDDNNQYYSLYTSKL